jgi:hypothetical protein
LLPIVPPTGLRANQPVTDWEVGEVAWEAIPTQVPNQMAAYRWAQDLCETFEQDLKLKPSVDQSTNGPEKYYNCEFAQDGRLLSVRSDLSTRRVVLRYDAATMGPKDEALNREYYRLKANEIRPY